MVKISINKIKTTAKGIFVKENKDYLVAEGASGLAAIVTATASSIVCSEFDLPKPLNSLFTYGLQLAAAVLVNAVTYNYMHKKEEDPDGKEAKKHAKKLAEIGSITGIAAGIVKYGVHYGLLATGWVPYFLSAPIAYTLPGIGFSYYKHKKNYENGILCIKNHKKDDKKPEPASIDDVAC